MLLTFGHILYNKVLSITRTALLLTTYEHRVHYLVLQPLTISLHIALDRTQSHTAAVDLTFL